MLAHRSHDGSSIRGTGRRAIAPVAAIALLAVAITAAPSVSSAQEPIDDELEKYWNVELAVPSRTNPKYERAGTFEATLITGVVPNDSFYMPIPAGVRLGYHFTDSVSLEGSFAYLLGAESDLLVFLKCPQGGDCKTDLLQGVKKPPHLQMLGSADLVYSPFHGKFGLFAAKLSHFDLGVAAGVGLIAASIDTSDEGDEDNPPSQFLAAAHWGMGFRFYTMEWLALRLDYRQFLYKPADAFLSPVEFTVGLSFLTR